MRQVGEHTCVRLIVVPPFSFNRLLRFKLVVLHAAVTAVGLILRPGTVSEEESLRRRQAAALSHSSRDGRAGL